METSENLQEIRRTDREIMTFNIDIGIEDLGPYQLTSRREIVALLRNIDEHNQLLRMIFNNGLDTIVTSILQIDETGGSLIIDCAPNEHQNRRAVESDHIAFETQLDRIRILFFSDRVESCLFEDAPAFRIALPASMVRLQRREYYRVATPRCTMTITHKPGDNAITVTVPVQNISAGGIGIIDETRTLDDTPGRIYENCRISLSGGPPVVATLEIRNTQDVTLANGKSVRRLGCLFVDLPKPMLAQIQRYITKLEREQNSRSAGMA